MTASVQPRLQQICIQQRFVGKEWIWQSRDNFQRRVASCRNLLFQSPWRSRRRLKLLQDKVRCSADGFTGPSIVKGLNKSRPASPGTTALLQLLFSFKQTDPNKAGPHRLMEQSAAAGTASAQLQGPTLAPHNHPLHTNTVSAEGEGLAGRPRGSTHVDKRKPLYDK